VWHEAPARDAFRANRSLVANHHVHHIVGVAELRLRADHGIEEPLFIRGRQDFGLTSLDEYWRRSLSVNTKSVPARDQNIEGLVFRRGQGDVRTLGDSSSHSEEFPCTYAKMRLQFHAAPFRKMVLEREV